MKIIENRKKFFLLSLVVILIGIGAMVFQGSQGNGVLNWDVEFTGGTSMLYDMGEDVPQSDLIAVISDATGQSSPQVQEIVGSTEVTLKLSSLDSEAREALTDAIQAVYPNAELKSSSDVSGTVSSEMQMAAIKATLIACVAMLLYISLRFRDFRAGGSAILALVHDVLIVLAAYAVFRIPVNNTFIAVLLTVLGYSVNSTIVIFDRIRENRKILPEEMERAERFDTSVKQTLRRSIHTSVTTFLAVGAVYFLGVQSIKEFALPMMVGIIAGAYSSICISASIWYTLLPEGVDEVPEDEVEEEVHMLTEEDFGNFWEDDDDDWAK